MNIRCGDTRWRCLILSLAVLLVLGIGVYLYWQGLDAGALHSLAVLTLVLFALAGAVALGLLVHALFRRWCELRGSPPKGQGTREKSGPGTVHLPGAIYKRPDPLIYSQSFLMAQGLAVTWDNPDIWLTEPGGISPVPSHELAPDHLYRVHALIHNGSTEAPVVRMPVDFSFWSFGIGGTSTPIGSTAITLSVKGAVGEPREAAIDWRTPVVPGHYCLQVRFSWPDDLQPANNLGQENVMVPNPEIELLPCSLGRVSTWV